MFTHILLPTDGSPLSEAAMHKGIQFAKSINAKVTGFHAIQPFHIFTLQTEMSRTPGSSLTRGREPMPSTASQR